MRTICVWNTAFLGDAVLTLPLIQTLHAAWPEANIHFWVRKGVGALFRNHPAISEVFEYDKRGSGGGIRQSGKLGKFLAQQGYSLWIGAHTSLRSAMLARSSSAKIRIGYDAPWFNRWLYTDTVSRCFDHLDEIERLLQLLTPLRLPVDAQTTPVIAIAQDAGDRARALLGEPGQPASPLLGMHPGSVWGTKRWPAEYFAQIGALALESGARVALFAGPGEENMAAEVKNLLVRETQPSPDQLIDLAGQLSLPELAACLGLLSCYLTNDSGPMHIAWPQGTPVTALFGPTVRQLGFFPRGEMATVKEVELACRPCGLHGPQQCPLGHHDCMRQLTPDLVWPDVAAKLFGSR